MKKLLFVAVAITVVLALMFSAIGCEGSVGPQGLQGSSGPQGIKGDKGARGPAGEQGLRGVQGPEGDKGERGAKGKQGDDGPRGYTGATGQQGEPGPQGEIGSQGPQGEQGFMGLDRTLILVPKDTETWRPMDGSRGGILFYNPEGVEFTYGFVGYGLEVDMPYSLIYYADKEQREINWGGNNPGALIATGVSKPSGNLFMFGSEDLGMDLPCDPDTNISIYDYSSDPDYYIHAHGAKIWLVPTDCLTSGVLPVIVWSPGRFLFETDLIVYIDTDS